MSLIFLQKVSKQKGQSSKKKSGSSIITPFKTTLFAAAIVNSSVW